jgi:DNA-binding transcriptional MocR family regulator
MKNIFSSFIKPFQSNYQNYVQTIAEFPLVQRPAAQRGLSIWIEFDKKIRTTELYDLAIKQNISIAPGRMFYFSESV